MTLAASVNQGRLLPKGAAYNRMFFMGVTGLSLTVTVSKNGAAFGALAGTVTEVSVGWYKAALTSGDTDTEGDLAFHATDGGANIEDWSDQVAAQVKLADGVAHGGTLGSSTATLAMKAVSVVNMDNNVNFASAFYAEGISYGMNLVGDGNSGVYVYGGSCGFRIEGDNAVSMRGKSGMNGNGSAIFADLYRSGDTSDPLILLDTNLVAVDAIRIISSGAGKHDIALAGSGDIQGTLTGTVLANVKKVNDVTVTGTGASGNEWGP